MAKTRIAVPRAISDAVMKAFNHRCARCGTDLPQIHHIDEDPSNNDPLNLIPLCPNCHLIDQHDPTRSIDRGILKLFRIHRDPFILKPQFQPLFNRMRFFDVMEEEIDLDSLRGRVEELLDFIEYLELGPFYAKQIKKLIEVPMYAFVLRADDPYGAQQQRLDLQKRAEEHYKKMQDLRDRVHELAVELLRFQKW